MMHYLRNYEINLLQPPVVLGITTRSLPNGITHIQLTTITCKCNPLVEAKPSIPIVLQSGSLTVSQSVSQPSETEGFQLLPHHVYVKWGAQLSK